MVGENFEIYWSQMPKNASNSPPWLEKIKNLFYLQYLKYALKLSTMFGENFEIYSSQMPKNAFKFSTMVGENFKI